MKAVIDTNVWLDWLAFEDPATAPLRRAAADGRMIALAPGRARAELADVLAREPVVAQVAAARRRRGLPALDACAALSAFDAVARIAEPGMSCDLVSTDPDDQVFVDLAVAAGAHWLFTKDRALLRLARAARRRHGLRIVPPAGIAADGDL